MDDKYRNYMINTIRIHWFYAGGELEQMSTEEIKEIFEDLLDWL